MIRGRRVRACVTLLADIAAHPLSRVQSSATLRRGVDIVYMADKQLERTFSTRLDPETSQALDLIQEKWDLSPAWVLRQAVREYLSDIVDPDTGKLMVGEKVGPIKRSNSRGGDTKV